MNKQMAIRLATLLGNASVRKSVRFNVERIASDRPLQGFHQWADGRPLVSADRVTRSDENALVILLIDWRQNGEYYCVVYPGDRSSPLVEIWRTERVDRTTNLWWDYKPMKRDGRNAERVERFRERMGSTRVNLPFPTDAEQAQAFLSGIFDLVQNRLYADGLLEQSERPVGASLTMGAKRAKGLRAEGEAAVEPFDPHDERDGRRRVMAGLVRRQGQSNFRRELLHAYDGQCAITGWAVPDVLEAAHVLPYRGEHTNYVSNGLLLRSDLHVLFDLHLIEIDPDTYSVLVDSSLADTPYGEMHGQKLRLPVDISLRPSPECLRLRSKRSRP
jgi:hypothetical protein